MSVWIGNGLVLLSAVLITACIVAYGWTTWGGWRDSEWGRHMMLLMLALAAVLGLAVLRIVVVDLVHLGDPAWFQVIRVAVFALVPIMFARQLAMIIGTARDVRRDERAAGIGSEGRRERAAQNGPDTRRD